MMLIEQLINNFRTTILLMISLLHRSNALFPQNRFDLHMLVFKLMLLTMTGLFYLLELTSNQLIHLIKYSTFFMWTNKQIMSIGILVFFDLLLCSTIVERNMKGWTGYLNLGCTIVGATFLLLDWLFACD
jgi:hypothetical protein